MIKELWNAEVLPGILTLSKAVKNGCINKAQVVLGSFQRSFSESVRVERWPTTYEAVTASKHERTTEKLPRAERVKNDRLYPLEVIAKDGDRVKVHYIGYSSQYDEWRQSSELETLSPRSGQQLEPYQPFELHQELAYSIKLALVCSRKDPNVPTEMPFDLLLLTVG